MYYPASQIEYDILQRSLRRGAVRSRSAAVKPAPRPAAKKPKRANRTRPARRRLAPPDRVELEMQRLDRLTRASRLLGRDYQPSLASLSRQLAFPRIYLREGGVLRANYEYLAINDRIVRWRSTAAIMDKLGYLLDPPPLKPKPGGARIP